jgi:hypothetical protein
MKEESKPELGDELCEVREYDHTSSNENLVGMESEVKMCIEERPAITSFSSKIREINVTPLDYGFIIRVGCQSIAITSKEDLIKYLTKYITNPNQTEKEYNNQTLFK